MIRPEFLDDLARYDSHERAARSRHTGERATDAIGEGLTFADYRRYVPGDDLRFVDWNLYARTDDLYVKQFEAERSHTVHVLVDASASMDYGSDDGRTSKFEYAAKLGLGFAYLTAREYNEFRFSVFDDRLRRLDRGRSTRGEVRTLVERCNDVDPTGSADFEAVLSAYLGQIDSKAFVLVCSDFLDDVDAIETGVERLSRNQLLLAHVVAPGEVDLPGRGDTVFEALESERSLRTYVGERLSRRYRDRFEEHATEVERIAESLRARYERVDTGGEFFEQFGDVWLE